MTTTVMLITSQANGSVSILDNLNDSSYKASNNVYI